MLNYKDISNLFFCFSLGVCFTSSLIAQQAPVYRQPTQVPTYQTPTQPLYQPQYPNTIINGQIINGQPINGQPMFGRPIQNGGIVPPIVQGGTILPLSPTPATQLQPTPAQLAANIAAKEKMAGLETKVDEQAKKIQFLVGENVRLGEAVDKSSELKVDNQRLQREIEVAGSELASLRNKPENNNAGMETQQQEKIQQLTANYQKAAQQNELYVNQLQVATAQLEALGQENNNVKNELTSLRNAGANMTGAQAELSKASTQIGELSQQNQTLSTENARIQGLYNNVSANTDELVQQNQSLTAENTRVQGLFETASADDEKQNEQIAKLMSENGGLVSSLDASRSSTASTVAKADASNRNSTTNAKVDELMSENSNLIDLRDAADLKNEMLTQKLSDLEGTVVALESAKSELDSSNLGVKLPAVAGSTGSKFSASRWLIPFFLVGLGVALYVFLTEERNAGVKTVAGRDKQDR